MKLSNNLEEARKIFDHVKNDTREIDVLKKDTRMLCKGFEDNQILFDIRGDESTTLPIQFPSVEQYLKRATKSRYAPSVWNFANTFLKRYQDNNEMVKEIDPELIEKGLDLINTKISKTNGKLRLHVLDDRILGCTSTNFKKLHDSDLLGVIEDKLGSENFKRAFWNPVRSIMEFGLDKFTDNAGQKWDFNLRIGNNEFGHHKLNFQGSIVRQICTNGMIGLKTVNLFQITHYGKVDLELINPMIELIVKDQVEYIQVVKKSMEKAFELSDQFMKELNKKLKQLTGLYLNKKQFDEISIALEKEESPEYKQTMYGLANAVSRYANDFPESMEESNRYYELQNIAGAILSMPEIIIPNEV